MAAEPDPARSPDTMGERTRVLFERHGRMVLGLCRVLLRDSVEAEDAAQQTFVNAHRALLGGTAVREEAAWLAAIARNECRARIVARMREPLALSYEDLVEAAGAAVAEEPALPSDAVREALAELPERQRDAVVLRDLYGLRYREVGAALGLSRPAVESLLFRARRRLRARLRPLAGALVLPVALRESLAQALPGFASAGGGGAAVAGVAGASGVIAKLGAAPLAAKVAAGAVAVGAGAGSVAVVEDRGGGRPTDAATAGLSERAVTGDPAQLDGALRRRAAARDEDGPALGTEREDDGDSSGPGPRGRERLGQSGRGGGEDDGEQHLRSGSSGRGPGGSRETGRSSSLHSSSSGASSGPSGSASSESDDSRPGTSRTSASDSSGSGSPGAAAPEPLETVASAGSDSGDSGRSSGSAGSSGSGSSGSGPGNEG